MYQYLFEIGTILFFLSGQAHWDLVQRLVGFANKLGVDVAASRCQDQQYLNYLHSIYERSYDGDPRWLDYHEHIHLCESQSVRHNFKKLTIDYREKAGPLVRKFDRSFRDSLQTRVDPGRIYISWAELGKTPYHYWDNSEPDDLARLCELAKPWLIFRPKLTVALTEIDFLADKKVEEFEAWWKQYHDPWCQHWNINEWCLTDMFSVSAVGHMSRVDELCDALESGHNPQWIKI